MTPDLSGKRYNGNGKAADLLATCHGSAVIFCPGSYKGHGWLVGNLHPADLQPGCAVVASRADAAIIIAAAYLDGLRVERADVLH